MTVHTTNTPAFSGGFLAALGASISGFFDKLELAGALSAAADARHDKIVALGAKTDEELAAMGLRREDIVAYVFRDLIHL